MTATADIVTTQAAPPKRGYHPGLALLVIAGAQLMIVLDGTIVNIALPHMQTALKFSDTGLSWVLNAYTLTFGGLMLLGGRMGDILGRRRTFGVGIAIFILASLLGGFAQSSGWLLAMRALQGVGGAVASPTALALITTNFMEGKERNRAFGVFAAVSGAGAAIGLLLGGVLTDYLSWRWVLFVNVPIGILIIALVPLFLAESKRQPGQFDLGGALTSTVGMSALVYGFIHASDKGWSDTVTIVAFVSAVVLLAAFFLIETRHSQPIVPLRLFASRDRSTSYAIMFAFVGGMMGMFFFLTQFVQNVLGYSPIKAGVAFLPIAFIIGISAQISSRFLIKTGPKPFTIGGALLATGGLAWLAQLSANSGYVTGLLGPMLMFGFGMGFIFVPLTMTAVSGVRPEDSGAGSAMLNVMQQVGGSLGLSILVTVFATASRHEQSRQIKGFLAHATPAQQKAFAAGKLKPPDSVVHAVLAHGISVAFSVAIIFAGVGLLLSLLSRNVTPQTEGDVPQVMAG